jgi:1,6-anhydro-N-acetylmuramate kinase
MSQANTQRPSARQLAYLRALAQRTGQTFAYPQTGRQASLEIQRLEQTAPDTPTARAIEIKQTRAAVQQLADSSAIKPDEISGYGSNCWWSH